MLEIKFIRQNQETIQRIAEQKGIAISIKDLLAWEEKKLQLLKVTELLRETRNNLSQQFAKSSHQGNPADLVSIKTAGKEVNQQLTTVESTLSEAVTQFNSLMILVPNVISPDTPISRSDEDNVEIKRVGEIPSFNFEPKDHLKLGEIHDIIDIPRGVKVAGKRNYFLKGNGLHLHRAVQQLTLDLLTARGFTALDVPLMVRGEALSNTAFFPLGVDQTFEIVDEDKWLVGTSEVPMVSYYSDEIIDVKQPIKLAAISACFRSEVGASGKDVHGLYRVHQFAKVEQVILCENDPLVSERILQEITCNAEEIMHLLELPYRVVAVCTGDMSQKTYKQYDIETWMPSLQAYGETHSSSNLHDFQARRSNIRYRTADGTLQFCHTLNNTAVASPRILIPLLENHQEADGSMRIPKALQKYMNGLERLTIKLHK